MNDLEIEVIEMAAEKLGDLAAGEQDAALEFFLVKLMRSIVAKYTKEKQSCHGAR